MEEIFLQYLNFIFTEIKEDIIIFNNWWMIFIFPAIIYFMFLFLKYWILLMPIWLPTLCIGNMFKNIFGRETIYIAKKKKNKTTVTNEK